MSGIKAHQTLILTAVLAVPALAQIQPSALAGTARTTATTRIEQPATLTTSQDLSFAMQTSIAAGMSITAVSVNAPNIAAAGRATGGASRATGASTASTSSAGAAPNASGIVRTASSSMTAAVPTVAQATFTVAGDSGQAISVTVPPTVDLARDGGVETARLTTSSNLSDGPQFLGGSFGNGGTMSFAVGGQVTLASNTTASGTYNGVLAVIAQYN